MEVTKTVANFVCSEPHPKKSSCLQNHRRFRVLRAQSFKRTLGCGYMEVLAACCKNRLSVSASVDARHSNTCSEFECVPTTLESVLKRIGVHLLSDFEH